MDRMGLRPPKDLDLITIHDEPVVHYDIRVPTAVLPELELGHRAVAMLMRCIQEPGVSLPAESLALKLMR